MRWIPGLVLAAAALSIGAAAGKNRPGPPPPPDPMPRDEAGHYVLQDVVQAEGATAAELYGRARAWVANTYGSANRVVQLDDPESGRMIVKGTIHTRWVGAILIGGHTLTIEVKDGRYRYVMTDFRIASIAGNLDKPLEEYRQRTPTVRLAAEARALLASLQTAMLKPTPAADPNW
jgi:hypothetical protein